MTEKCMYIFLKYFLSILFGFLTFILSSTNLQSTVLNAVLITAVIQGLVLLPPVNARINQIHNDL